jgi:hypothetical protein
MADIKKPRILTTKSILLSFLTIFLLNNNAISVELSLFLNDPYSNFESNTELLYSTNELILNSPCPKTYKKMTPNNFLSIGATSFITFVAHEMAHLHVGRLYGRVDSGWPHITKEARYIPTDDQYSEETAAGPNQQEYSAYVYWKRFRNETNPNNSYLFLLNKLTSLGYFSLFRNVDYWNRGYPAPYEHYNTFGDHNFYLVLLNRNGINMTKNQMQFDLLLTSIANISAWDHFAYWYSYTFDNNHSVFKGSSLGDISYPFFSYYLTTNGPYINTSVLVGENLELNYSFPPKWFNQSTVNTYRLGGSYLFEINKLFSIESYGFVSYRETASLSYVGTKLQHSINNDLKMAYQIEWIKNDIIEKKIKHKNNGLSLSLGVNFNI